MNEAVNSVLGNFIPYKPYNYNVTDNWLYKRRVIDDAKVKNRLVNPGTDEHVTRTVNQDLIQWLKLSKETFKGQSYDY